MQRASQTFWSAEEHTRLSRRMQLTDTTENHVPIRSTEVGRTPQARDGVFIGVGVIDHDICRVIGLNLGGEICVDLNAAVDVLRLDGHQ
ncbi:hypothetical protein RRF57_006096 [Xylaria bambusicola]|uniref:Uncharacterized protein n=1 Tax=Xylaria bambusicola TaxID=326684 RepID=A0AAN7Z9M6_9PEZI